MTDPSPPRSVAQKLLSGRVYVPWMPIIKFGVTVGVIVVAFIAYEFLTGQPYRFIRHWWLDNPHMVVQPHLRAFDAQMPHEPAGAVPIEPSPRVPGEEQAAGLNNPLLGRGAATPTQTAWGRTYYQYYCAFCHGERGEGNGPVGESYVPRPADLRSPRIKAMSDGRLLRAMLTGAGHQVIVSPGVPTSAPVLEYAVPPDYWWYLVLYVRQLDQ